MDNDRFDTLARALVGGASRRAVLGVTGVTALGALGLAALLGADEAEAKKGGRKRKRKQKQQRRRCQLSNLRGKTCSTDYECCTSKNYICSIPFGGDQTDPVECCGELGAPCEFPSDCCAGFTCPSGGGQCTTAM